MMMLAAVTASSEGNAEPTAPTSMDAYLWSNRPLLIFAPAPDETILAGQRAALSDYREDLLDRDMVVIEVVGDRVAIDGQERTSLTAAELRKRYRVRDDAAIVLLVGKDGGVKIREDSALSALTLFGTIDAMPMRRREMRERR